MVNSSNENVCACKPCKEASKRVEKEVLEQNWKVDLEDFLGHLGSTTIFVGILLGYLTLINLF